MNSTTSLVARQYRLQQWADQIRECQNRSSDISVKEWCRQQDLTVANYYYRLKEVRKACLENISCDALPQAIVPIPSELMNSDPISGSTSGLEIWRGDIRIQVTGDTSPALLKMVLQVAADVK